MTGSGRARSVRPSSAEIDEAVLDAAAALVARRGARDTSVQAVADATGFSKTGLLRRFPSKDALIDASLAQCVSLTEGVHRVVAAFTADDADRDAAAIDGLVDLALSHPGWAQVVLASIPPIADERLRPGLARIGDLVSDMFRIGEHSALPRRARVTGALGVLVTLALTYEAETTADTARPLIVDVCRSTLGYRSGT
ncbi:TetR/AcrR family transcriptional regulator [Microbacterium sp. cf332]|uniref:TetR/AcrR family transcriptional regulator n=1 Tax=Microbacterium sp. cf332 TaxID=1761804 RepID=UPI000890C072|nr:TetR/AcrR family transcriptional regulator [Microbacterium sp. cf332]SDQ19767.1 transcriptional regulator, TetR family [Microbacterium sp. cf332]